MIKLNVGIIGLGWMGKAHARALLQVPVLYRDFGVQPILKICADENKERSQKIANEFNFEKHTTDWEEVVNDKSVQLVVVATPNYMHKKICLAAAKNNKHIFCEKPVGRSLEEISEIYRATSAKNLITGTGFNYRYPPTVQYLKKLIDNGDLGDIIHFRGHEFSNYGAVKNSAWSWRFDKELAGTGVMGDMLCHIVDLGHHFIGNMKSVVGLSQIFVDERPVPSRLVTSFDTVDTKKGVTNFKKVSNEDFVAAVGNYSNNAIGVFEASRVSQGPKSRLCFEIIGNKGGASWDLERMNEIKLYLYQRGPDGFATVYTSNEHPEHLRFSPGSGIGISFSDLQVIEQAYLMKAIAEQKEFSPGFKDAWKAALVLDAIQRSWKSEKLETFSYTIL